MNIPLPRLLLASMKSNAKMAAHIENCLGSLGYDVTVDFANSRDTLYRKAPEGYTAILLSSTLAFMGYAGEEIVADTLRDMGCQGKIIFFSSLAHLEKKRVLEATHADGYIKNDLRIDSLIEGLKAHGIL